MTFMQGEHVGIRQLTLDFSEGFTAAEPASPPRDATRTIVFPKHIEIPNFGRFQRQINLLFAPLEISVEFRLTRQKRLEMKWTFPAEAKVVKSFEYGERISFTNKSAAELSSEELKAFDSVVFALAGSH